MFGKMLAAKAITAKVKAYPKQEGQKLTLCGLHTSEELVTEESLRKGLSQ